MTKRLTGKIDPSGIRLLEVPRPPDGLVDAYRELSDSSSLLSDSMDELGIVGALPASTFRPTLPGRTIVGPALTVRNVRLGGDKTPTQRARERFNGMAEMEAHNLTTPGDVLVIAGVAGFSNMGGVSSELAKRHGSLGAIVEGGIRDLGHSQSIGYPFWATEVSPITGKWRIQTVEINGPVVIGGIPVQPGDLVVADETGVCIIPIARAFEVLEVARKKLAIENRRLQAVAEGVAIADLPTSS